MSFLLGALPALFSSPFVRNVASNVASGLWNVITNNAKQAATSFVNNTVQQGIRGVQNTLKPLQGKRLNPFPDEDDGYDVVDEEEEDPGITFEEQNRMDVAANRGQRVVRRTRRPINNRKRVKTR